MQELWALLKMRVVYQVLAFKFFSGVCINYSYVAQAPIESYWAKVTPLNDKIASVLGNAVFAATIWLMGKYGLSYNWRHLVVFATIGMVVIDAVGSILTTWDVCRAQWFWLTPRVLYNVPDGVHFMVTSLVIVELAGDGNEGVVYALVSTVSNLSQPFAATITNNVNSYFDVTNDDIMADTTHVRTHVTITILLMYSASLASLLFLPLLPPQKSATQALRKIGGSSHFMGVVTLLYSTFALVWSVMTNVMAIFPATACLVIAGGDGCGAA